jgi:hypothetical protein
MFGQLYVTKVNVHAMNFELPNLTSPIRHTLETFLVITIGRLWPIAALTTGWQL